MREQHLGRECHEPCDLAPTDVIAAVATYCNGASSWLSGAPNLVLPLTYLSSRSRGHQAQLESWSSFLDARPSTGLEREIFWAVPVLAGRMQDRVPRDRADLYPAAALEKLKKLYFEVAHATYPWPMAAMTSFAPMSQVLFVR